jgi:hypothetical protein
MLACELHAGKVYKTFTFRAIVFIELSPAFATVFLRAGELPQAIEVETPKLPGAASVFLRLCFNRFARISTI